MDDLYATIGKLYHELLKTSQYMEILQSKISTLEKDLEASKNHTNGTNGGKKASQ